MPERPLNLIAAGSEDDVPRQESELGKICVVGGTLIVRGIRRDEERQAIHRVFQVLVSIKLRDDPRTLMAVIQHPNYDDGIGAA